MKFRIVEKRYKIKTEFHPEWFCDNKNACNYGWNNVHDGFLDVTPTKTYDDSLKRIEWFSNCFQKPIDMVIHNLISIGNFNLK